MKERDRLLKLTAPELLPSTPQGMPQQSIDLSGLQNQTVDLLKAQNERLKVFKSLSSQTSIDVATLEKLYAWYSTKCNQFGRLNREQFQQGLVEICGIKDMIVLEQMFRTLDTDFDGQVDFRTFFFLH